MSKIILIGIILFTLGSCSNNNPHADKTTEVVIDNNIIKLEKICDYSNTPSGVSIITLNDGKRFIYCETRHGVAVTQIIENQNMLKDTIKY